jgi:DnaK suppressor protein
MKKDRRDHFEKRLLKEREKALKAFEQLDSTVRTSADDDGELSTWPQHIADQGTDSIEMDKSLLLLSQEGRLLEDIDEALRRLYRDDGSYGRCERCEREIQDERLDVLPWTLYCVECQNTLETASGVADAADPREADGAAGAEPESAR